MESVTVTFFSLVATLWITRSFWLPAVMYQEAMEEPERPAFVISPDARAG